MIYFWLFESQIYYTKKLKTQDKVLKTCSYVFNRVVNKFMNNINALFITNLKDNQSCESAK